MSAPVRGAALRDGALGVGLLAVMLLGAWLLGGQSVRELPRSAAGFDGLAAWLREADVAARTYHGFPPMDPAAVDLRILPLHDTDPRRMSVLADTPEAEFAAETEVEIDAAVLATKLDLLPTVLILPKWRRGMRLAKAAHPALLVETAGPTATLAELVPGIGPVTRRNDVDARIGTPQGEALIYMPQTVAAGPCTPIFGDAEEMLLGRCPLRDEDAPDSAQSGFWLLTDPDLLNNQGLTQGDNARIAAALPDIIGASRPVVDYTTHLWASRDRDDREWSDLLEFLEWPFTPFWIGLSVFTALGLWSGAVRVAPAVDDADRRPGASKAVAITSKARLLRAAGHDPALVGVWLEARLAAAAAMHAPGHQPPPDPEKLLIDRLARAEPDAAADLGERLAALRRAIATPNIDPPELLADAIRIEALIARTFT